MNLLSQGSPIFFLWFVFIGNFWVKVNDMECSPQLFKGFFLTFWPMENPILIFFFLSQLQNFSHHNPFSFHFLPKSLSGEIHSKIGRILTKKKKERKKFVKVQFLKVKKQKFILSPAHRETRFPISTPSVNKVQGTYIEIEDCC